MYSIRIRKRFKNFERIWYFKFEFNFSIYIAYSQSFGFFSGKQFWNTETQNIPISTLYLGISPTVIYFLLILSLVNLNLLPFMLLLLLPFILLVWKALILYVLVFILSIVIAKFTENGFLRKKNFLIEKIVDFLISFLGYLLFFTTIRVLVKEINVKDFPFNDFLWQNIFLFPSVLLFLYCFISPKTRITLLILNLFTSSMLTGLMVSAS